MTECESTYSIGPYLKLKCSWHLQSLRGEKHSSVFQALVRYWTTAEEDKTDGR